MRVTLVRLDPTAHVLLLTLHHIVADGWSMEVLLRDLDLVYAAFARLMPRFTPFASAMARSSSPSTIQKSSWNSSSRSSARKAVEARTRLRASTANASNSWP